MGMISDALKLPDDVAALKEVIVSLHASIADIQRRYETENELLRERISLLLRKLYGRTSEKLPQWFDGPQQMPIFDEPSDEESEVECEEERVEVPGHSRTKRGRKPLPAELPRIDVIHDISEEEKQCECGQVMDYIGEETSEKLDIVPARMQVIRHIRYKYACKQCEGVESDEPTVKIAPMPAQLIPKGIVTPGLAAHVMTAKFVDGIPFYRMEKQFKRMKVDLSRSTMCGWAMKIGRYCLPLLELLHGEILSGPLINADETTVQVLDEPGRANTTKSYMWVFRGGPPGKECFIYQYHPTRSGQVAADFLRGYEGYVQTDGYSGYEFLDHMPGIVHLGCMAHARRKFVEVTGAAGKKKGGKKKIGSADVALSYIRKLYAIEKKARVEGLDPEAIYEVRQNESVPILHEFKKWLDDRATRTPPKGLLGKAISYTLRQWDRLIKYVDSGLLMPDNNLAENAIRPFVVGRKAWLFSGNPKGARASAALYSLIETAKANGLEPYAYLRYLFEKLPLADSTEAYKALLPQYIDKASLVIPA